MQNSTSNKIIHKWLEVLPEQKIDGFLIKSLDNLNKKGNLGNERELTLAINDLEGNYAKDKDTNS